MIEKTNETLHFTASGLFNNLRITSNVAINLLDNQIARVDNGMVIDNGSNVASFNMYSGKSLNINYVNDSNMANISLAVQLFFKELDQPNK